MACDHINQTACTFVPPLDNFTNIDPCIIEDIECHRLVHDYKRKTKQYLESTGVVTITETNGLIIEKVFVSARTVMKDITATFKLLMGQTDSVVYTEGDVNNIYITGDGCPMCEITFDTGKLNEYTDGDIECGVRKLIQISYITDDKRYAQKKVRRIEVDDSSYNREYDPIACVDGQRATIEEYDLKRVSEVYLINQGKCCGTDSPDKVYNMQDDNIVATGVNGTTTETLAQRKTDCAATSTSVFSSDPSKCGGNC